MDEDTKLVLDAWRVLLVENDMLRQRIIQLELEVRDVTKCIDVGGGSVPWRRVRRGRRGDVDSDD
jgi:hypothetical protein